MFKIAAEDLPIEPIPLDQPVNNSKDQLSSSDVSEVISDIGTPSNSAPKSNDKGQSTQPQTPTEDPLNIRAKDIIGVEVNKFLSIEDEEFKNKDIDGFLNYLYKNGWTQDRLIELYGLKFKDSLKEDLKMAGKEKKAKVSFGPDGTLQVIESQEPTAVVTEKVEPVVAAPRGKTVLALRKYNRVAQDLILKSSGLRKRAEEEMEDKMSIDEVPGAPKDELGGVTEEPKEIPLSDEVKEGLSSIEKELSKATDKIDELLGNAKKEVSGLEEEMESKEDLGEVKDLEDLVEESGEEMKESEEVKAAIMKEISKVTATLKGETTKKAAKKTIAAPVVEAKKDEEKKEEKKDEKKEDKKMDDKKKAELIERIKAKIAAKANEKVAAKKEAEGKEYAPFGHQNPKDWGLKDVSGPTAKAKERGINSQGVSWSKPNGSVDRKYFKVNASVDQILQIKNFVNNKLAKVNKAYRIATEKVFKDVNNPMTQALMKNLREAGAPEAEAQRIAMEVIMAGEDAYRTIEKEASEMFKTEDIEMLKTGRAVRQSTISFETVKTAEPVVSTDQASVTLEPQTGTIPLQTADVNNETVESGQVQAFWDSKRSVKK